MSFAFEKTSRISLTCKLVPVQYGLLAVNSFAFLLHFWSFEKFSKATATRCNQTYPGAQHKERADTPNSCHGVLTDRSFSSLNLPPTYIHTHNIYRLPSAGLFDHNII